MTDLPPAERESVDEALLGELTAQLGRTRRLLREHPERLAEKTINALAEREGLTTSQARIAARLALRAPLADPVGFPAAHRAMIRAIEVLGDEGAGPVQVRLPSIAGIVARQLVRRVAAFIIGSYERALLGRMAELYTLREAGCEPGTTERRLLARARVDTQRLLPHVGGGGLGGIYVLAGGALLPGIAWLVDQFSGIGIGTGFITLSLLIAVVLFAMLSFAMLRGAVVARRQVRTITAPAAEHLWLTIGDCGEPPTDSGSSVAALAIILTALVWFVLPVVIVIGVNAFA